MPRNRALTCFGSAERSDGSAALRDITRTVSKTLQALHDGRMSDDRQRRDGTANRWRSLPPRTRLEDLVAGQEVPPKPEVIAEPGRVKVDEATRYPA